MKQVKLSCLQEGATFYKNETDKTPYTLLFTTKGHVAFYNPIHGKDICKRADIRNVWVEEDKSALDTSITIRISKKQREILETRSKVLNKSIGDHIRMAVFG